MERPIREALWQMQPHLAVPFVRDRTQRTEGRVSGSRGGGRPQQALERTAREG